MGLFGLGKAKVCPLCGEEYKGLLGGEKTRDGEVCAECWSKFKSVSRDLISEYTTEQVRGIIEGGEVLKNGTCGVCGKATDLDALPISDGIICIDCVKILRGCYYNDTSLEDDLAELTVDMVKENVELSKLHMKKALDNADPKAENVAYIDDCFVNGDEIVLLIGVAKGLFSLAMDIELVHDGHTVEGYIWNCYAADGRGYETAVEEGKDAFLDEGEYGWIVLKDIEPIYELDDYIYSFK